MDTHISPRMAKIHSEYRDLITQGFQVSLMDLFNSAGCELAAFCTGFYPHPEAKRIAAETRDFCNRYAIWLPGAAQYVTCDLYLYPQAEPARLLAMTKNNCVDYWLNDKYGRDLFPNLSQEEKHFAEALIARMASVKVEDLDNVLPEHPAEEANVIVLREMRANSPAAWFERFLQLYNYHIGITHKDAESNEVNTVEGYIESRCHTSGMYYINALVEYCEGNFLDWQQLDAHAVGPKLRRLQAHVARFGCLSNDFFSFEKEVIDQRSHKNLLMAIADYFPDWSLEECITNGAAIVQNDFKQAMRLLDEIGILNIAQDLGLESHLKGLQRCVQASWIWQTAVDRYRRPRTIWKETQAAVTAPQE